MSKIFDINPKFRKCHNFYREKKLARLKIDLFLFCLRIQSAFCRKAGRVNLKRFHVISWNWNWPSKFKCLILTKKGVVLSKNQ